MSYTQLSDRFPLHSQRGNFSGKASAIVKSLISGDWWRADPSTGLLPETVERNSQFHINQGPVDLSIKNARETQTFASLPSDSLIGTYLPRLPKSSPYITQVPEEKEHTWREVYLWHPFTKKAESFIEFSIVPTKY